MGLFGQGGFDKVLRAQAIMQGDYGAAAQINRGLQKDKLDRAQIEELQRKKQAAFQYLIQQNVDPAQAAIMVEDIEGLAKAQADHWSELNKPRQFGPEGGSMARADGKGGYSTAYTAPAWQNGALFGETQGGNVAPQILHEGEKVVPIEAGGAAYGVKPYSGAARAVVAPNPGNGVFGQTVGSSGGSAGIPPAAIEYLRKNPHLKDDFDRKYGAGASSRALGLSNEQGGEALSQAYSQQTISAAEAERVRQSLGPNGQGAFAEWLRRNNIVVGN